MRRTPRIAIVTERSAVAMPEVGIGFFPDVGVSYLLARAPGLAGSHLALTGERIGAADAIYCGLADIHIAAARLAEIPAALADCRTSQDVRTRLDELAIASRSRPAAGGAGHGSTAATARDIRLKTSSKDCAAQAGDETRAALDAMRKASPTSLKVTLRNLRLAASFQPG